MEVVEVVGRNANSSSAIDKLKKRKKKKRRIKDGKRSTTSSGSIKRSPTTADPIKSQKSRSSLSCPPEFSQQASRTSSDGDNEIFFNETLRWLPFIARHSTSLPPSATNCRLHGATVSRLSSNSLSETIEEEEERIAVYKMNRRKRYLAAQQALIDLYPDTKVYASDEQNRSDLRRLPNKVPIFPNPPANTLDPSNKPKKFQIAIPSFVAHQDSVIAQKVI